MIIPTLQKNKIIYINICASVRTSFYNSYEYNIYILYVSYFTHTLRFIPEKQTLAAMPFHHDVHMYY